MADTEVLKVRNIASHLAALSDEALLMYIEDAMTEMASMRVPAQYEERAQRYLAAHLATIDRERPAFKSGAGLSATYNRVSGKGLGSTEYGQEVLRLLRLGQSPVRMI